MTTPLQRQVEARDRLVVQAELAATRTHGELRQALERGDVAAAQAAAAAQESALSELAENLRIYQAELRAQADELARTQARGRALLARFSALFEHMPVAVLLVADNGSVLELNQRAETLFGAGAAPRAVLFLTRWVDPHAYQSVVRPALVQAQTTGWRIVDQVPMVGAQGQRFIAELHIARLPPEEDGAGAWACAVVDRSGQLAHTRALQMALEANRQGEAFLADTARLARTGGWELTLRPRLLRWSPQLLGLVGLPLDTAAADIDTLLQLCPPPDRRRWADALRAVEHDGLPFELELDLRRADDGRPLRVRVAGRGVREDGPAGLDCPVVRVHGVLQDVSPQHAMRRELSQVSERLAIATDAGGIGVWDCDLAHDRLVLDARMRELFGLPPAAADAQAPGSLAGALAPVLAPESAGQLEQAWRDAAGGAPLNLEVRLLRPARWIHLVGRAPAADDPGPAGRLVGCAWDSTAQHEALRLKTAHDAAESANRAKSAFLSRMSHELRTPLNAILGFSQLMAMEAAAGDLVLKPHRVDLIEQAARHLLDLVNEVLDVAHIEAGTVALTLMRCDLRAIVAESIPLVQGPAAQPAPVTVHDLLADGPVVTAWADRLRLKELVINLLSNAVKYNRPGGRVTLHARTRPDAVELHVVDTGRGMTPQQLEQLFQPFNRLGAEALGIEGSGMGLFVCRRFVELMGGGLQVSSVAGQGTTVVVRLQRPPAEEDQDDRGQDDGSGGDDGAGPAAAPG